MATRSRRGTGLLATALCALAAVGGVKSQPAGTLLTGQATASLASGRQLLTPYVDARGDTMLLHVQPTQGGGDEQLLDARTGRPWPGKATDVMKSFRRLDTESAADVQAGSAPDQRMLQLLGCSGPGMLCTSPMDSDLVLMLELDGRSGLTMKWADLRPLMTAMNELMAGQVTDGQVTGLDSEWQLLRWASHIPDRRQRWLEALRGIDGFERWQRLADAAEKGPRLLTWPTLRVVQADDKAIDLAAELELLALRINVALASRAAVQGFEVGNIQRLADALLLGSQLGFRGDVTSHLVDVLVELEPAQRGRLAVALDAEARRRRHHGLWCYAEWVSARPCAGMPPWPVGSALPGQRNANAGRPTSAANPGAAADRPLPPAVRPATAGNRPADAKASSAHVTTPAAAIASDGDAQQEWVVLKAQSNKQVLLTYAETSGLMAPDSGMASGYAFVARSLGPVQEGRFELQISPNGRAPVKLTHGRYRVKVRLVLDYTREDRCAGGLRCLFSSNERYARTERLDIAFLLGPDNHHSARQLAQFGSLVPLATAGANRYASILKDARLAIDGVRFDLP